MIEHARTHLDTLRATPDSDELDIISARQDVAFHTSLLPDQPPSLQFKRALAETQAARTAAAGGRKIITEHDIQTARGDAERADLAARTELRARRQTLRRELDRTERNVATAFAAAQTATSRTLEELLASARSEVDLLHTAGHIDLNSTPLLIPDAALAAHEPHTADRLKALAAMPHQLSVVHADIEDRETAAALYTLRSTANADDRKVLWLTATDASTTTARATELADTITTIDHAHHQITEQQWALQPGAIVVIDHPATAQPDQLATITSHAASADARVILLDPGPSLGASSPALRLLKQSLPWNTTLTTTDATPEDPLLAPIPAVTLADRLGRTRLSEPWRQLLTEYDTAARAVRAAHRRHLALGWRTPDIALEEPDHALEAGIDDA